MPMLLIASKASLLAYWDGVYTRYTVLHMIRRLTLTRGVQSVHCTSHVEEAYTYTALELKGLSHLSLGS